MRTLKTIWYLTVKELRSLFGDPMLVLMIVFVFSASIYSVAKGVSSDVKNATVAVIDSDRSTLSYQIRDALQAPYFKPPQEIAREDVDRAMDVGDYIFVLDIPPNFERDVLAGRSPDVQLLIERIQKIQQELPEHEAAMTEEEAAFTEAAEEHLTHTQAQRRYIYMRR